MSSRNLSYTIQKKESLTNMKRAVKTAIQNNAKEYLNPPINNISYKGIYKTSMEVKKWFKNNRFFNLPPDRVQNFEPNPIVSSSLAVFRAMGVGFGRDFKCLKFN